MALQEASRLGPGDLPHAHEGPNGDGCNKLKLEEKPL